MRNKRPRMWALVVLGLAAASAISIKYHPVLFGIWAAQPSAASTGDDSQYPMFFRYELAANGRVYVCSGFQDRVLVREVASGLILYALELQGKISHRVACSDDADSILTACLDGSVLFWTKEEDAYRSMMLHRFESLAVCDLSKDGEQALLGTEHGRVEIRGTKTGKRLQLIAADAGKIRCVRFSPDETRILYACHNGAVHLWDRNQSSEVACFQASASPVRTAEFPPDGQSVVTGQFDGWLHIWDVESANEIRRRRVADDPVTSIDFSPCGRLVVCGTYNGVISVLHAADCSEFVTWSERTAPNHLKFSPDGRRLYAGLAGQRKMLQQRRPTSRLCRPDR